MSQLQTLYLSEDYWVLNKNPGIHSDEVMTHCISLPPVSSAWELVHRLDFETSGALLFCRKELLDETRLLFKTNQAVSKIYWAGASAFLNTDWLGETVHGFIASRYRSSKKVRFIFKNDAETLKSVRNWHSCRAVSMKLSRVEGDPTAGVFSGKIYEVELHSGARHQIRAFFAACESPLVGDPVYGGKEGRLELHARRLKFTHPKTKEIISVEAPLR